jgi:hypothetical protein
VGVVRGIALVGLMSVMAFADLPGASASNEPFIVSSAAFDDGGIMSLEYTGNIHDCHGGNVSPPLAWRNAPAGTRSFAVVTFDFDGRAGLGVVHWVAYGIPSHVTALSKGAGGAPGAGFTGGSNVRNSPLYAGPCPPSGDPFHHYMFTVYALDLTPESLSPGLSRDKLMAAMSGHIRGVATIVGRFRRE